MCCCGKPWREFTTEFVKDDVSALDDPDEWANDETGKRFSTVFQFETRRVDVVRINRVLLTGDSL
jgi:hypothetical protein